MVALLGAFTHLFYFHGYRALIANSSFSSTVELVRRKMLIARDSQTLVLGNSTAAEGFPASFYNKTAGKSTPAINLGIPSGHMFLYDKVLTMALESGLRPKSLVLIVTPEILTFSSSPYYDFLKNDLSVLKVELNLSDALTLRYHSRSLFNQLEYAAPVALRPALYTADLRDLAAHPVQRVKDSIFVSEWLQSLDSIDKFPEPDHAYAVCDAEPLDDFYRRLETERQKPNNPNLENLEKVWAGYEGRASAGSSLAIDAFETERLRSLLARFAEKVPHVFLALAPYYDPNYIQFPLKYRTEFERDISQLSHGNAAIHVLPMFQVDCTQMMDTVHLNRKGGEQFATFLHDQIESVLAAEPLAN